MTIPNPDSPLSPSAPATPPLDERGQRARDRVLLFVRGMELPPLESVDLARESLNRSGTGVPPAEAMRVLRELLAERGLAHSLLNSRGERQLSAPPMNRHSMIAEELDRKPWLTALRRAVQRLTDLFRCRNAESGGKDHRHG